MPYALSSDLLEVCSKSHWSISLLSHLQLETQQLCLMVLVGLFICKAIFWTSFTDCHSYRQPQALPSLAHDRVIIWEHATDVNSETRPVSMQPTSLPTPSGHYVWHFQREHHWQISSKEEATLLASFCLKLIQNSSIQWVLGLGFL